MRQVKNDEGFLQYNLSDYDMISKPLPGDVFSSTITQMKISREFMKILQGLQAYHIGQKLIQDDQVYQTHQLLTDLDA